MARAFFPLIIFCCCILSSNLFAQDRQSTEFKKVIVKHLYIDTMSAKESNDLNAMGIRGDVSVVKQYTVAYVNGRPLNLQDSECEVYHFDEKGNNVQQTKLHPGRAATLSHAEKIEDDSQPTYLTPITVNNLTTLRNNVYAYNKLQEIVYYDKQGNVVAHLKYRYNAKGDVVGYDSIFSNGAKTAYVIKYDRFHNVVYQKNCTNDADACEVTLCYTYDSLFLGRILVKNADRRNLRTGQVYNYTTYYSYNSLGQPTLERVVEANGNESRIVYTYNNANQLVSKDMYFPDNYLREEYVNDSLNNRLCTYYYVNKQLQYKRTNEIIYREPQKQHTSSPAPDESGSLLQQLELAHL